MAERHGGSIESCGCMSSRVAVMQRVCTKLQGPQALNVAYKEDTLRKMLRARVYDNWTRQKVDKARQFTRIVNPRSSNLTKAQQTITAMLAVICVRCLTFRRTKSYVIGKDGPDMVAFRLDKNLKLLN